MTTFSPPSRPPKKMWASYAGAPPEKITKTFVQLMSLLEKLTGHETIVRKFKILHTKYGAPEYRPRDFDLTAAKEELKSDNAANSLALKTIGAETKDIDSITAEQIVNAFNKIVKIPELYSLVCPEALQMEPDAEYLLAEVKSRLAAGEQPDMVDVKAVNKKILFNIYHGGLKKHREMHPVSAGLKKHLHELHKFRTDAAHKIIAAAFPGGAVDRRLLPSVMRIVSFVLMIPLGEKAESADVSPFFAIRLKEILPAYGDMFRRLLKEGVAAGMSIDETEAANLLFFMMKCAEITDELCEDKISGLNASNPNRKNIERKSLKKGIYNFYRKAQEHICFEQFALLCPAHYFYKINNTLIREFHALRKLNEKLQKAKSTNALDEERFMAENNKLVKRLSYFPPHWAVENEPAALLNDIILLCENGDLPEEDIHPGCLWNALIEHYEEERHCGASVHRKFLEYEVLLSAAAKHKTLWGFSPQHIGNLRKAAKEHIDADDEYVAGYQAQKTRREFLEEAVELSRLYLDIYDDIESFRPDYAQSVKKINTKTHYAEGGLLFLRYDIHDHRALPPDKICSFLGFLSKKQKQRARFANEIIYAYLESLYTGAPVTKIINPRTKNPDFRQAGAAAGLYVTVGEKFYQGTASESVLRDIYRTYLSTVRDFNSTYPLYRFRTTQVMYTGRARHLHYNLLTPAELSHVAGALLPEACSALHYIEPRDILGSLKKSGELLVKRLISMSENGYGSLTAKRTNRLIKLSKEPIMEFTEMLESSENLRRAKWEKRPRIVYTDDESVGKAFDVLLSRKSMPADGLLSSAAEEWFISVESIILFLMSVVLGLRVTELKRLTTNSVSFKTRTLIITAKSNIAYKESRVIPAPSALMELLEVYRSLKKKLALVPGAPADGGGFFAYGNKSLKNLNAVIRDDTGNPFATAGALRKYAATRLHILTKELNMPFSRFQAVIGHTKRGFEPFGSYSNIRFSRLAELTDAHGAAWTGRINAVTDYLSEISNREYL